MTRTRPRLVGATLVAAALLLAACSDDDEPTATNDGTTETAEETTADDAGDPYGSTEAPDATEEESSESTEAAAGATVAVAESDLGSILVDGQGNTLYMFTSDTQGEAGTCTDGCAGAWPALVGAATAGDGVDDALLGTVAGAEGAEQATYNGWPLYYYAQDTAPGDTNGQGVGGVWWVLDAEGNPIES